MMTKRKHKRATMYPYSYIHRHKRIILIWQGNDRGDRFLLDKNKCLIGASSVKKLKESLGSRSQKVQWSEAAEINFDAFWSSLRNLRAGKASSQKTCTLLLWGWNFTEDMLRTFRLDHEIEKLRSPSLNKVYDKLFYGNNMPSITPEGKSYEPIWLPREILSIRNAFRDIWIPLRERITKCREEW